ncbi:MAG TPA: hypothetical protein VF517_16550 [Thermoleophilaceae bacterium]|jgi:hypothetical protein
MPHWRDDIAELAALLGFSDRRPPPPEPDVFEEKTEELAAKLAVKPELADALLEEAKDHHEYANERAESAERRATTLQGAVAIASSLTLAGGSLLLDSSKLQGIGWKIALGLGLVGVTLCLIMAGYRAVTATSRLYQWAAPDPVDIFVHAGLDSPEAVKVARAADLLKASGINQAVASRKVVAMGEAAMWFTRALFLILALAVLLAVYGAVGRHEPAKKDEAAQGTKGDRGAGVRSARVARGSRS